MVSRSLINVDGTLLVLPSGEASAEQSNNLLGKRDSLLLLKLSCKAAAFCDQSEHIAFVEAGFNFDVAVLMNVAACQEKNLFNVTFLEILLFY